MFWANIPGNQVENYITMRRRGTLVIGSKGVKTGDSCYVEMADGRCLMVLINGEW